MKSKMTQERDLDDLAQTGNSFHGFIRHLGSLDSIAPTSDSCVLHFAPFNP
jgi:hypothetical protein